MSDLTEIRASALPLAFQCPGSARPPALRVETVGYDARLGRAVHAVLRTLAETGSVVWAEVDGAAERFDVRRGDVGALCAMAQKLWPALADSFRDPLTEVEMASEIFPGVTLTGHADAIALSRAAARILDWKTGRKDHDYGAQMRGYAALALLEDHELTEATATVVWIRDGQIENYTMTRPTMAVWLAELSETVLEWDGVFHAGGHCGHCRRYHECEAAHALARRDVAAISDRDLVARVESGLAEMAAAEIIDLLSKADTVAHLAERVRAAVKQHVLDHGDIVDDRHRRLTIDVEARRQIDTKKALPVVLEALGLDVVGGCLTISISALEGLVARGAGRGNGAAAKRAINEKLIEAGAVTTEERFYLKEKRA